MFDVYLLTGNNYKSDRILTCFDMYTHSHKHVKKEKLTELNKKGLYTPQIDLV